MPRNRDFPPLSETIKETANLLRDKKIRSVRFQPFAEANGDKDPAMDPVIVFTDGSCMRFLVQETEVGEYGVKLIYPARGIPKTR